jgi:CHAT domain-containing protein
MQYKYPQIHKFAEILLTASAILLSSVAVFAQPDRVAQADTIFEEAKVLIAANTVDSLNAAIPKLEQAAQVFKASNALAKLHEAEVAQGKVLRILGTTEMNAGRDAEAIKYFQAAVAKLKPYGNALELAFAYHNLGLLFAKQQKYPDSVSNYNPALDNYRAVGNKEGVAIVYRNLGLVRHNEGRFADAIALFESALAVRTEMHDLRNQAILTLDIGDSLRASGNLPAALIKFRKSLDYCLLTNDKKEEALARFKIGEVQGDLKNYKEALPNLNSAAALFLANNDPLNAAIAFEMLSRLHNSIGNFMPAVIFSERAADIYKGSGDKDSEGSALLNAALNYQSLSRATDAKAAIARAEACFAETKNAIGHAYALLAGSNTDSYLNDHDKALEKIRAAEAIFKTNPVPWAEYRVAQEYAGHFYSLSNYGEAIKFSEKALALAERDNDDIRRSGSLIDLANDYSALGQIEKAIAYTSRSTDIARRIGSTYLESVTLSNIGYDYFRLNKYSLAETNLKKAIVIMRANGYVREEGYAVHNLGLVYKKRRQYKLAQESFELALDRYEKSGDRRPEAFLYDSFGELYRDLRRYQLASDYLQRAVLLAREIRYSDVEASALANMMGLWSMQKQPRLAILYGKQSINVYQSIRAGNAGIAKASMQQFVESNQEKYRQLANLLIDQGRLGEAQQVLDLLKQEEFKDFVRRDASEASEQAKLSLTDNERLALDEYTRLSADLTSLGARYQTLQDAKDKAKGKLPEAEDAEFKEIKAKIEAAGVGVRAFLSKLSQEFSKKVEDDAIITPASIEALRADLRSSGPDVVLVSTYLLPDRYRALVTTGRTMVDRKVEYSDRKLKQEDVYRKIAEFQRILQNPRVDPRPLGKELYDIFVKPIEGDLRGAGAKTILWSLDGPLRYIPMAALSPDGKTYLAENYQNVVVTLARQSKLFDAPTGKEWVALGAGVSKAHQGFSALPSVVNELNSIVSDGGGTGVLDGTKLLDEKFDIDSLRSTLPQTTDDGKTFNVVHLATHFKLGTNDQDSALLMGDGKRLSLFEIGKDEELDFRNVELLALSACETGVSAGDGSGREVESLGMLAQKKGAKAVLATLWKVADEGTSMFMSEFYRLKKANPQMSKAEAIRTAQKEMIDGKIKATGQAGGCRAEDFGSGAKTNQFKCDPNAPFSHPYFWSPFILIGNWR